MLASFQRKESLYLLDASNCLQAHTVYCLFNAVLAMDASNIGLYVDLDLMIYLLKIILRT